MPVDPEELYELRKRIQRRRKSDGEPPLPDARDSLSDSEEGFRVEPYSREEIAEVAKEFQTSF